MQNSILAQTWSRVSDEARGNVCIPESFSVLGNVIKIAAPVGTSFHTPLCLISAPALDGSRRWFSGLPPLNRAPLWRWDCYSSPATAGQVLCWARGTPPGTRQTQPCPLPLPPRAQGDGQGSVLTPGAGGCWQPEEGPLTS